MIKHESIIPVYLDHIKQNKDQILAILLLLFWQAPVAVCSAIRRHQPPQRAVLNQVDCFVRCKVVGSEISLDGVQSRDMGMLWITLW